MPGTPEEDLQLIMTCLKYTRDRGKPDFDAAADELGVKAKTLYHRHWSLYKKWGMTGSKAANAGSATSSPATPTTPSRKRARAVDNGHGNGSTSKKKNNVDEATAADDDNDDNTPVKKRVKKVSGDKVTNLDDIKEHVDGDEKKTQVVELDGEEDVDED